MPPDFEPEAAHAEQTPLEKLAAAVQEFAVTRAGEPVLVADAILVWEETAYNEDGDVTRAINYASMMPGASMASGIGLLEGGKILVLGDGVGYRARDIDEE